LSDVLDRSLESNGKVAEIAPPVERKEHLDKILEKASFLKMWDRISVKLDVKGLDNLKEKEKIMEILTKAGEKAKVVCAMNYDTLLTGGLCKIIKQGVRPDVDSLSFTISNKAPSKTVCYSHNVEMFTKTVEDFQTALADPATHYLANPRKTLLSESAFSDVAVREFRSRRQRLPFAVVCMRKTGQLTFFVGDWAHKDVSLPNSSILCHYTTLDVNKFVQAEDLATDEWKEMEKLLEVAASPTDMGIGSVSLFMHENRGNIICAKVIQSKDPVDPVLQLKLYPHASCRNSRIRPHLIVNFNDNGEDYASQLGETNLVKVDTSFSLEGY